MCLDDNDSIIIYIVCTLFSRWGLRRPIKSTNTLTQSLWARVRVRVLLFTSSMQNRLDGEPYIHYLVDEGLDGWSMKQRKKFQDRQDSQLYDFMYIDYMNDPAFWQWTPEDRREYHDKQLQKLKTENIDWSIDARFEEMDADVRHDLKRSVRRRKRKTCVVM